jgi:hypothetical protein
MIKSGEFERSSHANSLTIGERGAQNDPKYASSTVSGALHP